MLAIERHREILSVLGREGSVRVVELADRFRVTEETIRRDLGKLESQGKVVRSHGGALMMEPEETLRPFAWREVANEMEKAAIAQAAILRIEEGDRILLDARGQDPARRTAPDPPGAVGPRKHDPREQEWVDLDGIAAVAPAGTRGGRGSTAALVGEVAVSRQVDQHRPARELLLKAAPGGPGAGDDPRVIQ